MYDQCGTPAYIAPEILKGAGYEGPPVDFWSAGVVLYAMLSGTVPFKANDMNELHRIICKGEYTEIEGLSKEVVDLLHGILEVDPKKRLTSDDILNHPWMYDADENGTDLKSKLFVLKKLYFIFNLLLLIFILLTYLNIVNYFYNIFICSGIIR